MREQSAISLGLCRDPEGFVIGADFGGGGGGPADPQGNARFFPSSLILHPFGVSP